MKASKFFLIAALALIAVACSKEDKNISSAPEQPNGEITITASIESDGGATTRALSISGDNIASTWETTDEFAILFNDGISQVKRIATVTSISENSANITFTIPTTVTSNTACTIVYPASAANATNDDADVAAAVATQDGELATAPDVRKGTATIDVSTNKLTSVTKLTAQNAIFKFTLSGVSADAKHPLLITDASDNVITTVTPTSTKTELYVAMPAAASTTYKFQGSTDEDLYTRSGTATITAGKYYQTTLAMSVAPTPLTLKAEAAGTITITNLNSYSDYYKYFSYSKNGGAKTAATSTTVEISVAAGDVVRLYASKYNAISNDYSTNTNIACSADCQVFGNVMSLLASDFSEVLSFNTTNQFKCLFKGNTHIKNHATKKLTLPATTLSNHCYDEMFYGCTGLTEAPVLQATKMAAYCCENMFYGCTGLTTPPSLSSVTTLDTYCFEYMFRGCTNLSSAPTLSQTSLANGCYFGMFYGCTSLETAPALPATVLADFCYREMFQGCTKLTKTPDLPATTLNKYCYQDMFNGCSSLNSVKCLATDISAENATTDWLKGVAATGTFTTPSGTGWTLNSDSGIPSDWIRYSSE